MGGVLTDKTLTQHQKILTLMCRRRNQEWWLPQDFMQHELGDLFVGYEASARLAELGKRYPQMIQTLPEGKYKKRRLRLEDMPKWYRAVSTDLQQVIQKEFNGVPAEPPPPPEPPQQQTLMDMPIKRNTNWG